MNTTITAILFNMSIGFKASLRKKGVGHWRVWMPHLVRVPNHIYDRGTDRKSIFPSIVCDMYCFKHTIDFNNLIFDMRPATVLDSSRRSSSA